jgi:hypothetical protein
MNFAEMVKLELTEMKKHGMRVPAKAFKMTEDKVEMADYDNMSVSECADLLIALC